MTRRAAGGAALLAALIVIASGLRPPASGLRPLASEPARRIISIVPAITEMLFAIGAGDRVVGVSSFDEYPPEVRKLPRVGGLLDPDLERIFALRPDLVIVYASQTELEKQLARAGIATFAYRHGGVAHIPRVMRELGERAATQAGAERAAREIEQGLADVRARFAGGTRPRVLLVFGRDRGTLRGIYASGGRGFLHDLIEIGGGTNVIADIDREAVQASTELVLARAPDVLLEIHGGATLTEEALARERGAWSALPGLPAVRNRRVHVLSGPELVIPGPRIVSAARRIASAIHPEIK